MSVPEIKCPTCNKPVQWTKEAKFRPFCSHRCRIIDLGDWVTEGHKIPGERAVDEMMSEEFAAELLRQADEK